MQPSETINIFSFKERCFVPAIIVSIVAKHVCDFEEHWQPALKSMKEEDKYWDWAFKKRISLQDNNFEAYALECENMTQGLIMLETQWHHSRIDGKEGDCIVYVENLASAPWNRTTTFQQRSYQGVGANLLLFARQRSLDLGYGGRVGLHSLPDAIGFYEGRNMPNYGADPDREYLDYFEYGEIEG